MLRNVKVGTKLFVILLAPVVVIVALVGVGVRDRRAAASDAARAEELSSFALVGSDMVTQLQLEQVRSALFTASRGEEGRDELDEQRVRTDAALARYQSAIADIDPGEEGGALAANLGLARNRLGSLSGVRGAVDDSLTQPYAVAELFGDIISSFVGVNSSLAGEANDPALLRGLDAVARVEQIKEAQSAQATLLVAAAQVGGFTDRAGVVCPAVETDCMAFERARATTESFTRSTEALSRSGATLQQKQAVTNADGLLAYQALASTILQEGVDGNVVGTPPTEALQVATDAIDGLAGVDTQLTQQVVDQARSLEEEASRSATLYLLFGAAGLAVAFAIAVVVARSVTRPLARLTRAAGTLSTEQLPALVEQLRNPGDAEAESLAEAVTPIEVDSRDEIGELAEAFNSIQAVTVDVAEEQSRLLRKGIGDIFVNLARRNQSLLDRQIEFIDHLESNERDPDQLENLFRLDHLATRMKRNAESLLVLAGADPPRRRGRPVPVADVVRVAIGEVEDYSRVHLLALDDATVAANVAADLAHLLSELMENATNASPPHTSVEVLGHYDERNGYVLTVADRGIGMSEEQLAEANDHLAHPPVVGLAITRSLGLTVVGRLAARYGLTVSLAGREDGGVVATVALPYGLVEYPGEDARPSPSAMEVMASVGSRPVRTRRAPRPETGGAQAPDAAPAPPEAAPEPPEPSPAAAPVAPAVPFATAAALPSRAAGRTATGAEVTPAAPAAPATPATAAAPVSAAPASPVAPATPSVPEVPSVPSTTPAGLPQRRLVGEAPAPTATPTVAPPAAPTAAPDAGASPVPTASPSATGVTAAGLVRRTPVGASDPSPSAPVGPSVTRTSRSPEEVRRMLSRYRSGLDRGRVGAPGEPGEGDGGPPPGGAPAAAAGPTPPETHEPGAVGTGPEETP